MISLTVNNQLYDTLDVEADTPLLWVLREHCGLTGTKYGCGIARCGACTVLLTQTAAEPHSSLSAVRACKTLIGQITQADQIITIEGLRDQRLLRDVFGLAPTLIEYLSDPDRARHPLQRAWLEQQVPQCGYCQSGQIMAAAALLYVNPQPSDDDINRALAGNLCRCGTYLRIRKAVRRAAEIIHHG